MAVQFGSILEVRAVSVKKGKVGGVRGFPYPPACCAVCAPASNQSLVDRIIQVGCGGLGDRSTVRRTCFCERLLGFWVGHLLLSLLLKQEC